jgi:XTP/dITP diphosphohydrolase
LLFALINYARFHQIHPEDALEKTNKKFIQRFQYMEEQARRQGKNIAEFSLDEMENWWQEAKKFNK